jgi:NTE family protein
VTRLVGVLGACKLPLGGATSTGDLRREGRTSRIAQLQMDTATVIAKQVRRERCPRVERPPFECIALLLQGGGALGAYQAGVYEALAEANLHPDWIAGISIGSINAALIAGNPPDARVGKLREFWTAITTQPALDAPAAVRTVISKGNDERASLNQLSATCAMLGGVPGFFAPRFPSPWLQPAGSIEATSFYDTQPLRHTLKRFVDFDLINSGTLRFSVGAVNVRTGNFVYFDTATHRIQVEHVLASAALPPGFPPIEIEGEHYWDGGLVSNTPLQWVLQYGPRQDTLAFQVDLWSALGNFPQNIAEVATRQKEITYSSRTRDQTDRFRASQRIRHAVAKLLGKLPEESRGTPDTAKLSEFADQKVYNIVHLIYRARRYEGFSKDFEFSRQSMEEHWRAGYYDTVRTLRNPDVLMRPESSDGVSVFDVAGHTGY